MALRFLLPADQVSHFAKRLLSHHQRTLAVAEGESSSGRNTRQLFRRRAISCRPDQKRRLHLRQQLQIGFGAQPNVNHRIRQRRFIDPQPVVRDIGNAVGRDAQRQQQLYRQPFERDNTLRIHFRRPRAAHLP